jgi:hypothetical protein
MPIEFTHLHNLLRTYQRSLHLTESSKTSSERTQADLDDRVSISEEARDEHRQGEAHSDAEPDADPSASNHA